MRKMIGMRSDSVAIRPEVSEDGMELRCDH